MPKVWIIEDEGDGKLYVIDCPACKMGHPFRVGSEGSPSWDFNGDMERPTFSPSMMCTIGTNEEGSLRKCHSFVRDGQIQFLSDSWHGRSDTVPLPDVEN